MTDEYGNTMLAPPPPPPRRHAKSSSIGDRVRFVLRGVGQTFISAGLVILLFVVYEVYITDIFAHQAQHKVTTALDKQWAEHHDPLPLPGSGGAGIADGTGIAKLYIPRLGSDYARTIVQGTDGASLEKGPGHYAETALPGAIGDFAVAGHRVGKGSPFLNLDQVKPGDAIIVETEAHWFVYRVKGVPGNIESTVPDGIPGREIVSPGDGDVILPVPNHPGAKPTERLMTLTTCHPKFVANKRMILHAVLNPRLTVSRTGTAMPASIRALYNEAGL